MVNSLGIWFPSKEHLSEINRFPLEWNLVESPGDLSIEFRDQDGLSRQETKLVKDMGYGLSQGQDQGLDT